MLPNISSKAIRIAVTLTEPSAPNIKSPVESDLQTSLPLPTATKGQKKNAKKSEAKKAQRHVDEIDRLQRLAKHKKDLERYVMP